MLRFTPKIFLALMLLGVLSYSAIGQTTHWRTLLSDSLNYSSPTQYRFQDLSLLTTWGDQLQTATALEILPKEDRNGISFPAIGPTSEAVRFNGFTTANSLKTTTAIDYRFPKIDRSRDTVVLEFDALWDTLSGNGETGRIVLALMHDMPTRDLLPEDMADFTSPAPFGRPAYNFRILNKHPSTGRGGLYFFYGGGNDAEGEVETYSSGGQPQWWLPGFIAQPGGTAPGTGGQYPNGPTFTNFDTLASAVNWRHFRFTLFPETATLEMRNYWQDDSRYRSMMRVSLPRLDSGQNMALAKINAFHRTNLTRLPLLYNYFPTIEGLRVYFRTAQKAFVTNITLRTSATPLQLAQAKNAPEVKLYPQPATEFFSLEGINSHQALLLFSADGKLLQTLQAGQSQYQISHLPKGMYRLKGISEAGKPFSLPLIKQ